MNQASVLSTRITTDADMIELTEWTLVKTTILNFFYLFKNDTFCYLPVQCNDILLVSRSLFVYVPIENC